MPRKRNQLTLLYDVCNTYAYVRNVGYSVRTRDRRHGSAEVKR